MVTLDPIYPLESSRLSFRPFGQDDLSALLAIHSMPEVARYLYWEPRTRDEIGAVLERKSGSTSIRAEGDTLALATILKETGELIGDCSLIWLSRDHRQGEIGFIFHPDHQGRGYATEAGHTLLRLAFQGLRLHRVIGRLEARNAASARVLEKLGMRLEGRFIENEYVKSEWQSELVYAILEKEWRLAHA
jgi:RimJ/RimL family protein N-acetyltransferase